MIKKILLDDIYKILDFIKSRPAICLGNDFRMTDLNNFITGYYLGGGKTYSKQDNIPDFHFYTNWLAGILKIKYEGISQNWSWLLKDKFKTDKLAFDKFFYYLEKFKKSAISYSKLDLTEAQINYCIINQTNALWCIEGNIDKNYFKHIRQLQTIYLLKIGTSSALFSLLVNKKGKIAETRNTDITGRFLIQKIEKQFGLNLDPDWQEFRMDREELSLLRKYIYHH